MFRILKIDGVVAVLKNIFNTVMDMEKIVFAGEFGKVLLGL